MVLVRPVWNYFKVLNATLPWFHPLTEWLHWPKDVWLGVFLLKIKLGPIFTGKINIIQNGYNENNTDILGSFLFHGGNFPTSIIVGVNIIS